MQLGGLSRLPDLGLWASPFVMVPVVLLAPSWTEDDAWVVMVRVFDAGGRGEVAGYFGD
jgi:hypothetical protein